MPQIKNRTIFEGDNLPILRRIVPECIDLIYLDPPFNSNRKYNQIFRGSGLRDKVVQLWDTVTGQNRGTLTRHTTWIRTVALSPNGSQLASGAWDGTVILWHVASVPNANNR